MFGWGDIPHLEVRGVKCLVGVIYQPTEFLCCTYPEVRGVNRSSLTVFSIIEN